MYYQWHQNEIITVSFSQTTKLNKIYESGTGKMKPNSTLFLYFKCFKEGIISETLSPEQRVVSLAPRACTKGIQVFEEQTEESPGDIIGRPVPHNSALQQTTGEAVYVDDMAKLQGLWLIENQYPVVQTVS